MTIEPIQLRGPDVSKWTGKTRLIIVIASVALSIIVAFSVVVVATSSTSLPPSSYPHTKTAICMARVLELAQKGIIRDAGGYNGAIYECTHMHGLSSVYGRASM